MPLCPPAFLPSFPVHFASLDAKTTHEFTKRATFDQIPYVDGVLIMQRLLQPCAPETPTSGLVFMKFEETFYKFDPRLVLGTSTLDAPLDFHGWANTANACPSAPKTFLNRDQCVRKLTCAGPSFSSAPIVLSDVNLKKWFRVSRRHVHRVTGLMLGEFADDTPCTGRSRWLKALGYQP